MPSTRRQFLIGCSSAIAAMAGSRVMGLSFAGPGDLAPGDSGPRDIMVVLFLRGGMDALNLVAPVDDPNYIAARGTSVRIMESGDAAGLPLTGGPAGHDFRLHFKAPGLMELYDSKQLAIVHACGLTNGTRSHFEAQDLMERGVVDMKQQNLGTGWLSRHLASINAGGLLPAASITDSPANSLLGSPFGVAVPDINRFVFYGDDRQMATLADLYKGELPIHHAGARAMTAMKTIGAQIKRDANGNPLAYEPENGTKYPDGDLSGALQTVGRLIKMDIGLQVAAVDYGGWDTHQDQADHFPGLVEQLSGALSSFYNDLHRYHKQLSVIVMSEFGRRLKANESGGTDHGHGSVMLALGANVAGGTLYGQWPGLANEQLDDHADLAVTTDFRAVLAELLVRRAANTHVGAVFPGLKSYQPLGIFKGPDLPTDLGGAG